MPLLAMLGGGTAARMGGFGTRPADPRDDYFGQTLVNISAGLDVPTSNNSTFLDSSSLAASITKGGNTAASSFSPFRENWSYYSTQGTEWVSASGTPVATNATTFTVEGWLHPTATQTIGASNEASVVGDFNTATSTFYWGMGLMANNSLRFTWNDGAFKGLNTSTVALANNRWTHVAVVVNSSAITLYVNGTSAAVTGTTTITNRSGTTGNTGVATYNAGTSKFAGFMSNISILSGVAKYTANFTPSKIPIARDTTGQTFLFAATNRAIDYNTATTAKVTTIGSSPVITNHSPVLTRSYNRTTDGGSAYFDGSDYLVIPYNANRDLGAGDFCVDCVFYATSVAGTGTLISTRSSSTGFGPILLWRSGSIVQLYMSSNGTTWNLESARTPGNIVTGQWNHVAVYRTSGVIYVSLNGAITTGTTTSATPIVNTVNWYFGIDGDLANAPFTGHISNVRVQVGSHSYTSTSAPFPTGPLSNTATTKLLMNFNNIGVLDNTGNFNIETIGGYSQIGRSKFGGRGLVFGAISMNPSNPAFSLGPGDFAIEFWLYKTTNGQSGIWDQRVNTGVSENVIHLYNKGDGTIGVYIAQADRIVSGQVSLNTWNHIAVTRLNGVMYMFLNGAVTGTPYTTSINFANVRILVGTAADGWIMTNGYISDLRVTRGYARQSNTTYLAVPTTVSPAY